MGDVFVRRTTAFLLLLVFILTVICVALIVVVVGPGKENERNVLLIPSKDSNPPVDHFDRFELSRQSDRSGHSRQIDTSQEVTTKDMTMTTETSTSHDAKMEPWEKNIRLPKTTIPYHYDLLLHPNLETATFEGHVDILIGVTSPMEYLLTHVKLMNVTSTELFDSSRTKYDLREEAFEYKPNQFWVVRPKKTLNPGNYTLSLSFNGGLKGHIRGLHTSEYLTESGPRVMVSSIFQPTDARRAFPCFDEPSFKSTFKTTLIRPSEGYIALSNMPAEKETVDNPSPGWTRVEFEKSVPMVTYLACFIVCDFDYVEVMTDDNKPFRVYSTPDQIERTHYARDIGVNILNYFEQYFEIKYPLPKQDNIAIPNSIRGGMEHWGLITYGDGILLYDKVNSSSKNKQAVAAVVSHELAHMWFGNLVTLEWWDDLWLNEGFASYIEYKGVTNYEKDWDMMHQFLMNDLHRVFELDQILSSHPIVQPVNHPDEILEIFDQISYAKGASVLRMLENFIGDESFRIGVRNFLRRFKYDNAVTQDLWDELQKTVSQDLNITRIMDTWTRQMGFPVLTVKTSSNDKTKLEVRQRRFLIDPDTKSKDDSPFQYKWDIPVTIMTKNLKRKQVWFKMEDKKIAIDRPADADWIKLNVDQYGYYRVNYENQLWTELISVLRSNHEVLSPSDRANLIDDSFSLAAAGQISYDVAFRVISYLHKETHYVPWFTTYHHLINIGGLLQNTKAYMSFRKYVRKLVDKHVERVGWEDTGIHIERRNRGIILNLACKNGHEKCLHGAVDKFKAWIQDPSYFIPANFRTVIYINGIKGTGEREWDALFNRYMIELNAQEKRKMLRGLASTKEPWIANRLLDLGRNDTIFKGSESLTMMLYLAHNPSTLPNVWSFVRSNWEWLVEKNGLSSRYLTKLIETLAFEFTSLLELKELKTFFEEHPNAGAGKRSRSQGLEKLGQNIKWVKYYAEPLRVWLEKNTM